MTKIREMNKEYQREYQKVYQKTRGKEKYRIRQIAYNKLKNKMIKELKRCQKCGSKENLEIHHIDYKKGNEKDNLMLVCANCHRQIHRKNK